ncbi:MAG: ligase-associated DNA damage response exonuclease [Pseudomonadota bacterium]
MTQGDATCADMPTLTPEALLHPTPAGLYCPIGDFYIDPVRAVDRAVVTHGHSDHARPGHSKVLATPETLAIMAVRMGENHAADQQAIQYGETVRINGVDVSALPAGHVLGSAQILVEHKGLKICVSGDYKRRADPTCETFTPVRANVFVTEATFGLPVFRHPDDRDEIGKLMTSLRQFPDRAHLVGAYALGKAQRVIKLIRQTGYNAPIFIHGALTKLCDLYDAESVDLGPLEPATINTKDRSAKNDFAGRIIVGPPSAFADTWARRFPDPIACFASGWMRVKQRAKQRGVELPLIVSDHADWDELTDTIRDVDPEEVWITHGREDALARWAELNGYAAKPLALVGYEDEGD